MSNLAIFNKDSVPERVVAGGIGVGVFGLLAIGTVGLAFVLNSFWIIGLLSLPIGYTVLDRKRIWKILKLWSLYFYKEAVKLDPIEALEKHLSDLYHGESKILTAKVGMLKARNEVLTKINTVEKRLKTNVFVASERQKQKVNIDYLAEEIANDKDFLKELKPSFEEFSKRADNLIDYEKNYKSNTLKLKKTIESAKQKRELYKTMADATGYAEEFTGSSGIKALEFEDNLKELEFETAVYVSKIGDFDSKIKPQIEQNKFEKDYAQLTGLNVVEEYNKKIDEIQGV